MSPTGPRRCPRIDAAIWHLAGLVGGDIPNEMIPFAAQRAMLAIDVQCMLRCVENGSMVYHDWAEKKELLPYVRFLKTDAAEAEILTGADRPGGGRQGPVQLGRQGNPHYP